MTFEILTCKSSIFYILNDNDSKTQHQRPYYYLRRTANDMFSMLCVCLSVCLSVCLFVCPSVCLSLSVCLSVSNITENGWTDFHEIFRVGGTWCQEQSGKFSEISILEPLEHRNFFSTFWRKSCLLATLQENDWMDFRKIFSEGRSGYTKQSGTFSECWG